LFGASLLKKNNSVVDDLERLRTPGEDRLLELSFKLWPAQNCASDIVDSVGREGRFEAVSIEDGDRHQSQ